MRNPKGHNNAIKGYMFNTNTLYTLWGGIWDLDISTEHSFIVHFKHCVLKHIDILDNVYLFVQLVNNPTINIDYYASSDYSNVTGYSKLNTSI